MERRDRNSFLTLLLEMYSSVRTIPKMLAGKSKTCEMEVCGASEESIAMSSGVPVLLQFL